MMNKKLINKLEDQGEKETRSRLAQGVYASSKKPIIENWLEEQNRDRQEFRDEEAFKISKESLECSKQANNTAKKANIISIIALIASFIISVVAVIRS